MHTIVGVMVSIEVYCVRNWCFVYEFNCYIISFGESQGGAGIVPLNVHVLTTFPGAISSSASCAISVYSFLIGVVELLLAVAAASVGPFICLLLSILITLEKGITAPNIADAIRMLHELWYELVYSYEMICLTFLTEDTSFRTRN
jgi:hypothetical protein